MAQTRKDPDSKKTRSRRLPPEQIAELIEIWPQYTIEKLAEKSLVSKATIEKIGREARKRNPQLCPTKKYSIENSVSEALVILSSKSSLNKNPTLKNGEADSQMLPSEAETIGDGQ